MEQFNLKMTLRHQNIDNTITSFVLCYIIFVNQSKLDRIRYTFQKTASVNDIPKCGRFFSLLGGFLASEFTLGELIWLDYLAGDFTLSGLIRR